LPWLGAYVTDFLLRAKEQGFAVPDRAIGQALRSMALIVDERGNYDYAERWWSDQNQREIALDGKAYAYYVLARAKQATIGDLRYFHDTELGNLRSPLAMAQTGAALALMGDRARAANAIRAAQRAIAANYRPFEYYATPLRDVAALIALAAETGQKSLLPAFVAMLDKYDARQGHTQTQEQAWLLVAAKAMIDQAGPLSLAVNDTVLASTGQPTSLKPAEEQIARGYKIANRGQGDVWRSVVIHGTPKLPPPPLAAGITFDKKVMSLAGEPVDLGRVQQNDRMVVTLSGEVPDKAYHQTILVDMLPAGWEIEGVVKRGKDGKSASYDWLGTLSRTRTEEARDDRFVSALDLIDTGGLRRRGPDDDDEGPDLGRKFVLAYVVRAVTPGNFTLPAAVVEDLYRPGVMARTASGSTAVTVNTVAGK
jgi:uncharacterized protein YfaS (alpha-2-macroglobulin family)